MENLVIDINCDVGEGFGNEAALLPLISSCNIACGGHAGDMSRIKEVLVLAKKYGIKVGAHPSYPDKENFGRTSMRISKEDLIASIQNQLNDFSTVLQREDMMLHHIKPHGALYNDIAKDAALAKTFLTAIAAYKDNFLYVPYNSVIEKEALKQGFRVKREAFADRNYNSDGSLVSRKLPNAVVSDPKRVVRHVLSIIKKNQITAVNGALVHITADTLCLHGDTPSALQILMYLSKELTTQNIVIASE